MSEVDADDPHSVALQLLSEFNENIPDDQPFPWRDYYQEELLVPAVARLHLYFLGLDTYATHQGGLQDDEAPDDPKSGQWVYGDTGIPVAYRLFRRWGLGPEDKFIDLGCGCGLPVFAASLLAGSARGVDIVANVIKFCQTACRSLSIENAEFIHGDIFDQDLSDFSFVYLAATTFPPPVRKRLVDKLRETRPGTRIVSVTHPIKGKGFRPVVKIPQVFSWSGWGSGYPFEFYLQQRI